LFENIVFSLNVVIPWVLMAAIGFLFKRWGIVDENFLAKGNKVVFLLCLPMMLFGSVYNSDLSEIFDLNFLLFVLGWAVLSFVAIWGLCLLLIKDKSVISAYVQGAYRSNVGALAVPLAFSVLGDGALRSVLALAILIPTNNVLCVILLTLHSKKEGESMSPKNFLLAIAKNPSIISVVLGIAVSLSGLRLPVFVNSTISSLSQVTVPLVLFCLGASIVFRGFDSKFKYALSSSVVKVIAMPVIATIVAYLIGFRGNDLAILMLINGVPTAIAGHVMVVEIGGDATVAANNIMLTTILSAFTLAVFIFVFRMLGVISA